MADLFDQLSGSDSETGSTDNSSSPKQSGGDIFDQVASGPAPSAPVSSVTPRKKSAPASGDIFDQVAAKPETDNQADSSTLQDDGSTWGDRASERFKEAWNNPNRGLLGRMWDVANTPLIDEQDIEKWTGRNYTGVSKGVLNLLAGLTSPFSVALTIGTLGEGTLIKAGGSAILKGAGWAAKDISELTKASEFVTDAVKAGKPIEDALKAAETAGFDIGKLKSGTETLQKAGLTSDALLNHGIIHRTAASMWRSAGINPAMAEKIGGASSAAVTGAFTAQGVHGAAVYSTQALDDLRDGDYTAFAEHATEALGSAAFAGLGAKSFKREAGGLMDEAAEKLGFNVKPSETNLKLRKEWDTFVADAATHHNDASNWLEREIRKDPAYKNISKDDLLLMKHYIESGLDDSVLAQRGNHIAESADRDTRFAIPDSGVVPLDDSPQWQPLTSKGNQELVKWVDGYNRTRHAVVSDRKIVNVDERAPEIARAYEQMKHDPNNLDVRNAYDALKRDVRKQWDWATQKMGVKFEVNEADPYKNSAEMMDDVRTNRRLKFFKTRPDDMPADHPLAEKDPETGLSYNDMFRAVHDLFGHATEGFEFGPKGEENAWNAHRQMFSREAIPALVTETKGQNSWVNFGDHLRNKDGKIPAKGEEGYVPPDKRPFAPQKAGLLPREFWSRGDDPKMAHEDILKHIAANKNFAILQAENPNNTRVSPEENAKATQNLLDELRRKGYEPLPVEGHTADVEGEKEHAFFVPHITAEDAVKFGRKYGQAGILTRDGLHWIKDNPENDIVNPSENPKLITGDRARAQDYFTVIDPQGKNLAFHVPIDMDREVKPSFYVKKMTPEERMREMMAKVNSVAQVASTNDKGQYEKASWSSSVDPRSMDEARIRELIAEQHVKNKLSDAQIDRLIGSYDPTRLTPEMRVLAKRINKFSNSTLDMAQKAGALNEGVAHYSTNIWKPEDADNAAANRLKHDATQGRFSLNTAMARRRMFASSFEGELLGKQLKYEDPAALAAYNRSVFGRLIAARELMGRIQDNGLRASDGRAMVALSGAGHIVEGEDGENPAVIVNPNNIRNIRIADKMVKAMQQSGDLDRFLKEGKVVKLSDKNGNPTYAWDTHDYRTIDHHAMHGWLYATGDTQGRPVFVRGELRVHPEAHEYFNRLLGKDTSGISNSAAGRALLKAGQEAKGVLLFGSPFHLFQEGLRGIMTGISPFGIEKFDLRSDPVLRTGVENGLTLGPEFQGMKSFEEGRMVGHSKILEKTPGLSQAQSWLQGFLFEKYIPGLKARAFRSLFERYKSANPEWTESKAAEAAAADTNERFGGLNYQRMGRAVATQDLFRTVALAPDWLESEIRFMVRAFGSEGKIARQDIARMAIGMWGVSRVLNLLTTGKMHNEAPFGVALKGDDGKEKIYSIRTMPTDMLHALNDPGNFLSGRVAPILKSAAQVYTGRDEYGRKIPTHNIAVNLLRNAAPLPLQTAVKAATGETPSVTNTDAALKAGGLTVTPYRTEAQKLAAELASNHAESGPVEGPSMRKHQLVMELEDRIRSGKMEPSQFHDMVVRGDIPVAEAKKVMNNLKATQGMDNDSARLYTRASRLPVPELLEVWDKATPQEKVALQQLLLKKKASYFKKAMTDMTPAERMYDPTFRKLRAMFPQEAPY